MKRNSRRGKKKTRRGEGVSWNRRALALGLALVAGAIVLVLAKHENPVPRRAEVEPSPRPTSATAASSARVPPFHNDANEAKPFPATLSPLIFDNPVVARAYQVAREIPGVLVQQPCYCFCQGHGHESLLDCYTDYHGAG